MGELDDTPPEDKNNIDGLIERLKKAAIEQVRHSDIIAPSGTRVSENPEIRVEAAINVMDGMLRPEHSEVMEMVQHTAFSAMFKKMGIHRDTADALVTALVRKKHQSQAGGAVN